MKNMLVSILLIVPSVLISQQIKVSGIEPALDPSLGKFFHPKVSPVGDLFFTTSNYKGLFYFDKKNKTVVMISDEQGAGYQPAFSADGEFVYFRPYTYKNHRKFNSLIKKSIRSKARQILVADQRDFTTPFRLKTGQVTVSFKEKLYPVDQTNQGKNTLSSPAVFIEKSKIVVYQNEIKKVLQPLGKGHYLWPSLSPQDDKILFTKAGHGTYICDLNGNLLVELGYANAPQWSPDSEWIVAMNDKDDGHKMISSEIEVISSDGSQRFTVTNTPDIIETYPVWGLDGKTLYFDSQDGIIYEADIEIK